MKKWKKWKKCCGSHSPSILHRDGRLCVYEIYFKESGCCRKKYTRQWIKTGLLRLCKRGIKIKSLVYIFFWNAMGCMLFYCGKEIVTFLFVYLRINTSLQTEYPCSAETEKVAIQNCSKIIQQFFFPQRSPTKRETNLLINGILRIEYKNPYLHRQGNLISSYYNWFTHFITVVIIHIHFFPFRSYT